MDVTNCSGIMIVLVVCWLATAQSENTPQADPDELSLIKQIENRRAQAIKLLNDTDAYEMATTISDSVEDTLKFFDDLGRLFRNGTLAMYICSEKQTDDGKTWCNLYALPNGSVPLKKSVVKLMFDVFHTTQPDTDEGSPAKELVRNWFSSATELLANERRHELFYFRHLIDHLSEDVIGKIWHGYNQLLVGYHGLKNLEESTWKNFTGELRTDGICSSFFEPYSESNIGVLLQVLDDLLGPHCVNESDALAVMQIRLWMKEIATMRNFNGGDSNSCFPEFLIRCADYDEAVYKTFVKDISTFIYYELTTVGLCLGMSPMNAAQREQHRSRWSERVGAVMKQMLDARPVLKEVPPSRTVEEEVRNAIANVDAKLASLLWKDRPALYGKAIRNAVRNLKLGYDSTWSSSDVYRGNVDGVMYLPYKASDHGIHCAYSIQSGTYTGSIDGEANYVVKYKWMVTAETLKENFKWLQLYKDRILEIAFTESTDDLCERALVAIRDRQSKRKRREVVSGVLEGAGFSAFVAVKCSYDFVWYELGWRYYTAARTTSDYVLEMNDGTFNASCGQLIFLP